MSNAAICIHFVGLLYHFSSHYSELIVIIREGSMTYFEVYLLMNNSLIQEQCLASAFVAAATLFEQAFSFKNTLITWYNQSPLRLALCLALFDQIYF